MKDKIEKKIAEERTKRVEIKSNLPKINKDLFLKLNDHASGGAKKKKSREAAATLLADPRFSSVFTGNLHLYSLMQCAAKIRKKVKNS